MKVQEYWFFQCISDINCSTILHYRSYICNSRLMVFNNGGHWLSLGMPCRNEVCALFSIHKNNSDVTVWAVIIQPLWVNVPMWVWCYPCVTLYLSCWHTYSISCTRTELGLPFARVCWYLMWKCLVCEVFSQLARRFALPLSGSLSKQQKTMRGRLQHVTLSPSFQRLLFLEENTLRSVNWSSPSSIYSANKVRTSLQPTPTCALETGTKVPDIKYLNVFC